MFAPSWASWLTDTQVHNTLTHHAKALSSSAFNSPKNLPETAHTPCQVTIATVWRKQKTNTGEKTTKLCKIKLNLSFGFIFSYIFLISYSFLLIYILREKILLWARWLLPVLEVDDMSSLQAHLQEIAQFYVLGCWARLWATVLDTC